MSSACSTLKDVEACIGYLKVQPPPTRFARFNAYLQVDVTDATYQLIWACVLTGFTSSIIFASNAIWAGFQTGGTIQLGIAVTRLFSGAARSYKFERPDQQALCSLAGFLIGASIDRISERVGPKKRIWLFSTTVLQAVFLGASALAAWRLGGRHFSNALDGKTQVPSVGLVALAFASASLGIQLVISKHLATQFGTAVVFTTVWVDLFNHPQLFKLGYVKTRDQKVAALLSIFVGGMLGNLVVDAIGSPGALGVGAGFRVVGAVWWLMAS